MAQINFLIRSNKKDAKVPIYVRIHAGRNNEAYAKIPRFVNPKYWNSRNQNVKQLSGFDQEDYTCINKTLLELKAFLFRELYKLNDAGLFIDGEWLRKTINMFFTHVEVVTESNKSKIITFIDTVTKDMEKGTLLTKKGTRYAKGTIAGYRQLQTKLNEFTENKTLYFKRINKQFGQTFIKHLIDHDYTVNYIGKVISRLKSIMNMARKEGFVTNVEYMDFPVYKEGVTNIYLSLDELKQMRDADLKGNKNLELARDIFLFGCYIGQRVSDYNTGKRFNITYKKTNDGGQISLVNIIQQKGSVSVAIPLRSEPLEILKKYNYQIPYMQPQKINLYIKEVGRIAKIDDEIEVKYTRGGEVKVETFYKYQLIKTHTARRSMITNMVIENSLTKRQMMLISGHQTEKDFNNYVKSGYEEQLNDIANSNFFKH